MDRGTWQSTVHGVVQLDTIEEEHETWAKLKRKLKFKSDNLYYLTVKPLTSLCSKFKL